MSAIASVQQRSMFLRMMSPLIWWVRLCRTEKPQVSAIEKAIRAMLMVPAFALLLVLLHIRVRLRGPLIVDVQTTRGERFRCQPPDLVQLYIWLFGVWEPDLTHFVRHRLRSGDGFIDVGSYIGYFTVVSSACVQPAGRVAAIEASPRVFASLQETVAMNKIQERVRLIHKAAAARPGTITVFAGPEHNTGLTTTVSRAGMTAQAQIEALPLDDLLTADETRMARLIKIDVEGGEPEALAGMMHTVRSGRPDLEIVIELSPLWWRDAEQRPIDVLQPFIEAGFHVYEMDNNYWPWRYLWPNEWQKPRRMNIEKLTRRVKRLDVVLSRIDASALA